jgi:hypothetical protein
MGRNGHYLSQESWDKFSKLVAGKERLSKEASLWRFPQRDSETWLCWESLNLSELFLNLSVRRGGRLQKVSRRAQSPVTIL